MPVKNREVECDVCGDTCIEESFGDGWRGWSIVQGVAAHKPDPETQITQASFETHLCPTHTEQLAEFIDAMQNNSKSFIRRVR